MYLLIKKLLDIVFIDSKYENRNDIPSNSTQGPNEDAEEELPYTVAELQQMAKAKLEDKKKKEAEKKLEKEKEEQQSIKDEEERGIDWGMGERTLLLQMIQFCLFMLG
jgi:exoribonuclease R